MQYAKCPLCHAMVEIDPVTKRFVEHLYCGRRCPESGQRAPGWDAFLYAKEKLSLDKFPRP